MDRIVGDFVGLLRRHRIRVSPAETIDALRSLSEVGLGDRTTVRDVLRGTLIKSAEDGETFDRLFDLYFGLEPAQPARATLHPHVHGDGGDPTELRFGEDLEGDPAGEDPSHSFGERDPVDLRRFLDQEKLRPSQDIHGDSERLRLSVFGQQLMLNRNPDALQQALQRITHQLRVKRARSLNPGRLATETGAEEIPVELPAAELTELVEELREMEVDDDLIAAVQASADEILEALPELIEAMLERQRKLDADDPGDDEVMRRSLRKLLDFSPGEQRELELAIRRVGREINGAPGRRLRRHRTGKISVAQTLRRNLRHEGVPFDPVLRRRREQRPRLVVLCDVSLSTRNLARLWLHLVYQLQDQFSKVRTFVYVADVAEVTQVFAEHELASAVDRIFGGKLIDVDENSDFGQAAERFQSTWAQALNRRTTVVVLGDGRNNGRPPNVERLEEIASRSRRLIWITPEPRWSWQLGGCDLPLYEPACDRVEVVRSIGELAGVGERLVRGAPGSTAPSTVPAAGSRHGWSSPRPRA